MTNFLSTFSQSSWSPKISITFCTDQSTQLAQTPDGKTYVIHNPNTASLPILKQETGNSPQMIEVDGMGRAHSPGAVSNITTLHDGTSNQHHMKMESPTGDKKQPRTYTRDPRHGMGIMKEANYKDRRKEQNKRAQANMRERKRKELETANKLNQELKNENLELKQINEKNQEKLNHLAFFVSTV